MSKKNQPTEDSKELEVAKPQAMAVSGPSTELLERVKEVQENIDAVENFQLPRIKMTSAGMELMDGEAPVQEIEGVIIHAKKTNVYYAKPYNPSDVAPPTCFSLDGVRPDPSIRTPQHATCKGCPQAEFGTNSMKSGKACRNLKPFYILTSDEAILPRQLTIAPTSLKAADQYLMNLTERGVNYRKVKTKITAYKENNKDTYCKLRFQMIGKLDAQRVADVEAIRQNLLPIMSAQVIEQREMEAQAGSNQSRGVEY
jgi:hypothetical protein